MTATTNGHAGTNGTRRPAPAPRPPDAYLGPRCETCGTPWRVHPNFDERGKPVPCAARRPASAPFDPLASAVDRREAEAARGRYRARTAPAAAKAPPPAPEAGAPAKAGTTLDDWRTGGPADVGVGP